MPVKYQTICLFTNKIQLHRPDIKIPLAAEARKTSEGMKLDFSRRNGTRCTGTAVRRVCAYRALGKINYRVQSHWYPGNNHDLCRRTRRFRVRTAGWCALRHPWPIVAARYAITPVNIGSVMMIHVQMRKDFTRDEL